MGFRVVLTDQVFPDVGLEQSILAEVGAELVVAGPDDDPIGLAADADAILTTYFPIGSDQIARLNRCRIIARYGIGVDNIDLGAARERGIVVTNVPDYSVEEVAVHTLLVTLGLLRRLPAAVERAASGIWDVKALRPIPRVSELTFGVVGLGRIGQRVISLLRPLGGEIVGHDPFISPPPEGVRLAADLEALLRQSDVVTLHLPLSADTHHLIDATRLGIMKPGAVLINTSRGGLVDTGALVAALRAGTLAGAALDVLEREPDDVALVADAPNLLLTPHMAYYSESSLRESQHKAATQVAKVLSGEAPDYQVN